MVGLIDLLVRGDFLGFLMIALVLVSAVSLHEFGHALAADLQGDPTPRFEGRLTVNPIKHLDPMGAIAMVLIGVGWGKPVPFSSRGLKSQRTGPAVVAIAGPAVNILLCFVGALAFVALDPSGAGGRFLQALVVINAWLAVFNLMPLPPLDGSRILTIFLPPHRQGVIYFLDRWGVAILILLLLFGLHRILGPIVAGLLTALVGLAEVLIP